MELEIRRGNSRETSEYDGVVSRHSFSFGAHYDPDNISFGALVCHNEDTLQPRIGYATHPHSDLEIVTWVLAGTLRHVSSIEESDAPHDHADLRPGDVQVLGAGTGVTHSEIAGPDETHFVQLWLTPEASGLRPQVRREHLELGTHGTWAFVDGIRNSRAGVGLARLSPETAVTLPRAQHSHLYVCSGTVELDTGQTLVAGDALRTSQSGGLELTGMGDVLLVSTDARE